MKDNLSNYMGRPKRYDNIDGTGEIFMGLMLLGFALVGFLQRQMTAQSFWMRHGLLFMYGILVPMLGLGFLIQKLVKSKITFPRTGYVALGSAEKPAVTKARGFVYGGILGAVFAIILCIVFIPLVMFGRNHAFSMQVGRFLYAALFIGVYAFWIARMGQGQPWKWGVLALSAAAMVTLAIMLPVDSGGFLGWFFPLTALSAGIAWTISGIGTLIVYICQHPITKVAE